MNIKEARRLTQEAKEQIEARRLALEEEERQFAQSEKLRLQQLEITTIDECKKLIEKHAKRGENECHTTLYDYQVTCNVKKFFEDEEYGVVLVKDREYEGYESYQIYKLTISW